MSVFTTGPVSRGADTDRVQVLALNNNRFRSVCVRVIVRGVDRRCPRRIYVRRRRVPPGRTVSFDVDLHFVQRYEVRVIATSDNVLYYVSGYRYGRWWSPYIHDPSTTFRHSDLVPLQ